jgi:hypothetical protein
LNNWGRIAPLARLFRNLASPDDEERIPEWKAIQWSKAQLEDIVRSTLDEIPQGMPEIVHGDNPLKILALAEERAFFAETGDLQ